MKSLNLCIDIDGTVTEPFYWLELSNFYFKTKVKEDEVKEYEIHKVLGITQDEYSKFYEKYAEIIHFNSKPRPGAAAALIELSKKHNIFYVSAREQRLQFITREWLLKNNMPLGKVFLLGSHHKVQKARELGCDIFIEDRYENAVELAKAGFNVLLIDCSYNRKPLIDGIKRVFNWEQVIEFINGIDKQKEIA